MKDLGVLNFVRYTDQNGIVRLIYFYVNIVHHTQRVNGSFFYTQYAEFNLIFHLRTLRPLDSIRTILHVFRTEAKIFPREKKSTLSAYER